MPPASNPIEAGLAAYQQGDYRRTIVLLESTPIPPNHPLAAKAQMGLAIAYAKMGQPAQAAALCQALRQDPNPQVRSWAEKTYASLQRRHPDLVVDSSVSSPSQANSAQSTPAIESSANSDNANSANSDLTGFVPLDADSEADDRPYDSANYPPNNTGYTADEDNIPSIDLTGFTAFGTSSATAPATPPTSDSNSNNNSPSQTQPRSKIHHLRSRIQRHTKPAEPTPDPAPETPPDRPLSTYQPVWRQAGRATRRSPLGKVQPWGLLLIYAGTAIAVFWMVREIIFRIMLTFSIASTLIPFLGIRRSRFDPPTEVVLFLLVVLFFTSRWVLDVLLRVGHGMQPLTLAQMGTYSPETAKSLPGFCSQKRVRMPALGILPTNVPIAFSYGLPFVSRIVVSQGLLDQLTDDEIATIYANEVGHLANWTTPLLSLVTIVAQVPYTLYWVLSEWGNQLETSVARGSVGLLASFFYGLYGLIRWVALALSRQRVNFSDRVATELTGNPNGYIRALLKLAIGTANDIQKQRQTSHLLESFDLLTPLGSRMVTIGSLYAQVPLESVLEWDRLNPYRHWLALNNSHPPLGDRLYRLTRYARDWRLEPELDLGIDRGLPGRTRSAILPFRWGVLLKQGAPFFGMVIGLVAVGICFLIGWIGLRSSIDALAWMYRDPNLTIGLVMIGFSMGTLIRLNSFFPETNLFGIGVTESTLPDRLQDPAAIPLTRQPIKIRGRLIGRSGLRNCLSQDLLLDTATGIVRLHWISAWGPIGNILTPQIRPTDLLNQEMVVTGWFRRGVTPWIDVEVMQTSGGRTSRSQHPLWSTVLAIVVAAIGAYIIARG